MSQSSIHNKLNKTQGPDIIYYPLIETLNLLYYDFRVTSYDASAP